MNFIASIKFLPVSAPGCHPQRVFYSKGMHFNKLIYVPHHPHWNDSMRYLD